MQSFTRRDITTRSDNTARRYRDRINPQNLSDTNSRHENGYVCKDRNTEQRALSTRDTANKFPDHLDLLSTMRASCGFSDKTLFILLERISQTRDGFQITTWHCRIHRLMSSPSNSQSRSKHRETDEQTGTIKEHTTDKMCVP